MSKHPFLYVLYVLYVLLSVVLIGMGIIMTTYLRNRHLPVRSEITEYLSGAEKAYIAEVFQLRNALGDKVWPGWILC